MSESGHIFNMMRRCLLKWGELLCPISFRAIQRSILYFNNSLHGLSIFTWCVIAKLRYNYTEKLLNNTCIQTRQS
jgi:hypothetical protein